MTWHIDGWVIFADDVLLAINKPAGLLSLPDGYRSELPHLRRVLEPHFGRLWIVHRLDKETSGVILLARTAEAHRRLNDAFAAREMSKVYHAIVAGAPAWETRTVDWALRPNGDRRHRTVVDVRRGKPAVTRLIVLQRFRGRALVEARPESGRRHQIRAHLAAVGLPIVGDALYRKKAGAIGAEGGADSDRLLPRLGLHAREIEIMHPVTRALLRLQAPYPPDFTAALERLRRT